MKRPYHMPIVVSTSIKRAAAVVEIAASIMADSQCGETAVRRSELDPDCKVWFSCTKKRGHEGAHGEA